MLCEVDKCLKRTFSRLITLQDENTPSVNKYYEQSLHSFRYIEKKVPFYCCNSLIQTLHFFLIFNDIFLFCLESSEELEIICSLCPNVACVAGVVLPALEQRKVVILLQHIIRSMYWH
jgi:hypothetical protein